MSFQKSSLLNLVLILGLLLGITQIVYASEKEPESTSQFRRIEQPLGRKIGVTLGGLALIGAELWWFLGKKATVKQAEIKQGIQELTVTVDGGYQPDYLVVQSNQPVRLNFLRKDANSCLEEVLIPDFGIDAHLPLDRVKTVEFTPQKPGEYQFTCGMRMFRGILKVEGEVDRPQIEHNGYVPKVSEKNRETAVTAELHQGIQEIDIQVERGYQPSRAIVKAGLPVRLNFFRKDPNSCLSQVLFPDFELTVDLPLHRITPVEFTPQEPGEYRFTCGMEMFYGVLEVRA